MKRTILFIMLLAVVLLVGCSSVNYDTFAQCLTESGAVFYGAYWCPHCEDLKAEFGDSIQHVNYVECSLPNRGGQTEICEREGIESYPTWKNAQGVIQPPSSGMTWMQQLSFHTGCPLP
jgi:thiol-disulfide isomerase/thioredoxin